MDRNSVDWHGSLPAVVTPFDAGGNIDGKAFRRNIELLIGEGVHGVVVSGCTGEFWAMTADERKRLFKLGVEAAAGKVPVIGGTSAIRTSEVIELTEAAKEAGCDGAMILPPYFVRPSADDIIAHFAAVSDAVEIPILLYNLPMAAVNALTPELVGRLADIENVVAIKESSGDLNNLWMTIRIAGDRIRVLHGFAAELGLVALELGSPGYIDSFPNYWGGESTEIYHAVKRGDRKRALELQNKGLSFRQLIRDTGRNNYAVIKAMMNLLGRPGGYPRLPLRPLVEPQLSQLRRGMEELGLTETAAVAAE
ncbi:MAG: dihydrodipicolinate synthase family protein [Rhodospirillales bacterium]|jgi:4-hydroxy-tetrahydrodipicolinate synthase|nr:dihydrodipicolinate synthase family protein [Rhodospirillales bacterium]